jgi:hypothetical protein
MVATKNTLVIFILFLISSALFLLGTIGGNPGKAPKNGQTQGQAKTDFLANQKTHFGSVLVESNTRTGNDITTSYTLYLVSLAGYYSRDISGGPGTPQATIYESVPYKNLDKTDCDGFNGGLSYQCQQLTTYCPKNGKAATGLFALAFIFSFVLFCLQGAALAGTDNDTLFSAKIFLCISSIIFFIAAVVSYDVDCFQGHVAFTRSRLNYMAIANGTGSRNDVITANYGPGFAGPLAAGIALFIAFFLMIFGEGKPSMRSASNGLAPPAAPTRGAPSMQV